MCALNKTKKGKMAFSYPFRTHLAITISAVVSGRLGAMSRIEVVFIKHELHCQWIALLRCSTISTKC